MIRFNKPVYAILNEKTNELVAPFKTPCGFWFRGLYESKKSISAAFRKFSETLEELQDNCKTQEDAQIIKRLYGLDSDFIFGKYKIVEIDFVNLKEKN